MRKKNIQKKERNFGQSQNSYLRYNCKIFNFSRKLCKLILLEYEIEKKILSFIYQNSFRNIDPMINFIKKDSFIQMIIICIMRAYFKNTRKG